MSFTKVKDYFEQVGMGHRVMQLEKETTTVELAAIALGCKPKRIAKTLSFLVDDSAILIVVAGDAKIDNRKYRDYFHCKARMIPFELVEEYVGHAPGGVCPFAINEGVKVFLDQSLTRFETVFPACGSGNSAIELNLEELEENCDCCEWIDVCKNWEE